MKSRTLTLPKLLSLLLLSLPAIAHAWWNEDWTQRTQITLNTTAQGVQTTETALGVAVPVRLHSGNFDFVSAKPDGSDIRIIAGDDQTPLKFWVERLDSVNELAVLWVQLPTVLPASDKNVLFVYAGNDKAPAETNAPTVFDSATLAAFHF